MRLTVVLFADNKRGPSSVSCCALWFEIRNVLLLWRDMVRSHSVSCGILVDKVTLEQVFLPVFLSSPVCDIPPILHRRCGQRR